MKRIKYIIDENPNGKWEDWIKKAYFDRVSLSATGYYSTPEIGYDFNSNSGKAFSYFTYGAASAEVEIDCLTGDHQVKKVEKRVNFNKVKFCCTINFNDLYVN